MICSWPAGRSMSSPASSCWWWEGWKQGRSESGPLSPAHLRVKGRREHHLHAATRQGDADDQREDGPGAHLGTGGADIWPGGHQPTGRRVRRGRGRRAGGHGLRPALPRDGPNLFALDARIGTGLRPLQHQAGGRQLRGQGPACRPDRRQGRGRGDRGHGRSQGEFSGLVSPGPRVVGGPFRSAGLAGRRLGRPAGRDIRGDCPAAAMQAAAPQGFAREPAAAVADGPAGLRNACRRGPAAIDGLRRRRRLAGAQLAGRGAAGRCGPGPRFGLLGHRVAAARRGLSPACGGRQRARTFEPITFHAMAHCLEQMGQADLAIVYYELACGGQWDGRFGDIHNIAQLDYLRFLRRVADGRAKGGRWPIMPRPAWPRSRPCSFATRPTWPR